MQRGRPVDSPGHAATRRIYTALATTPHTHTHTHSTKRIYSSSVAERFYRPPVHRLSRHVYIRRYILERRRRGGLDRSVRRYIYSAMYLFDEAGGGGGSFPRRVFSLRLKVAMATYVSTRNPTARNHPPSHTTIIYIYIARARLTTI